MSSENLLEMICLLCPMSECHPESIRCLYSQIHRTRGPGDWARAILHVLAPGEQVEICYPTRKRAVRALCLIRRASRVEDVDAYAWIEERPYVSPRSKKPGTSYYVYLARPGARDGSIHRTRYIGRTETVSEQEETPMEIKIARFAESDVDGPGRRAVMWVQGCPIECEGCQNKHLWPSDPAPLTFTSIDAAGMLLEMGLPITITGGEPFAQPEALFELVTEIKIQDPDREIILYTGLVLEDLLDMAAAISAIGWVLATVDVLVDGPYIAEFDDDLIQYRGSRNQRPIDMKGTLAKTPGLLRAGFAGQFEVVELDWDASEIVITPEGDILGAVGLVEALFGPDAGTPTRRCGQARE
jgi:anaerobic ribonucleoside-triphosphate reductase activating protein